MEIATTASTPGFEFIGNAKAGLKVGFGERAGVLVGVGSSWQKKLENLDSLRPQLLEAAKDERMHVGHAVVVGQQIADTGIVFDSDGSNADIAATTNFDVEPGGGAPSLASFGVDFTLHGESRGIVNHNFPNGFILALRVIKLGERGWWWWRRVVVEGIEPIEVDDPEPFLTEEDYFAVLPGARFGAHH